jgi:flagellar FliJ protein
VSPPLPPDLQSLHAVLEHAERERDAALAVARRAEAAADAARQQAGTLARYGLEYDARWGARPGQSGTPAMLHCVHGFVQRLEQARRQQDQACRQLAERSAQAHARLHAAELRVAAVRKLIERRMAALRLHADRLAQRQTDEAAQRIAWAGRDRHPARSC